MTESSYRVSEHTENGHLTVTCEGELDVQCAERMRAIAEVLEGSSIRSVIVDCSGVTFIDSMGVRSLIDIATRSGRRGIAARFSFSPAIDRVMRTLRMERLFPAA